ncbi:hypothetical protein [Frankia sp. Cppng1_Ct_nod]|uniref:hypothetical protein n=1 Tax=Frankia sp. Cppng1_Ct_nod TaxID=2897162 RepID=UPI0010414908|nr:hypothetical protein [Frankia sp. Cppng1_Ct_nod]
MPTSAPMTVVSSPEALATIDEMAGIINGALQTHFDNLRRHAGVLRDPANWDGITAVNFRDTVWPSYERILNDVHAQLDKLRLRLNEMLNEIQNAG